MQSRCCIQIAEAIFKAQIDQVFLSHLTPLTIYPSGGMVARAVYIELPGLEVQHVLMREL